MGKYIIYTPIYRDNSGGIIVLHKLCSMLIDQGCEAKIWPMQKPTIFELFSLKGFKKFLRWHFICTPKRIIGLINLKSPYKLSIARYKDLNNAIVVYPEIVDGNPINSEKVIRWLLNKPGVITGRIDFGCKDLFFYFDEHFNDWDLNPSQDNHLRVIELMSDVYKNSYKEKRFGTCYMVRKGKKRILDQHGDNAIKVDGLSHQEMAQVFNDCQYFISYDLYTMYSRYAAMCGCISIVIPESDLTKEQWRPKIENRYGIAYGWDDISWAIETKGQLIKVIEESQVSSQRSVENFIKISQAHFDATF